MTLSKSNFVVMSIIMCAVLFLFQFSNIALQYTSKATSNADKIIHPTQTKYTALQSDTLEVDTNYTIAIIGSKTSIDTKIAAQWCVYSKLFYSHFQSMNDYDESFSHACKMIFVTDDAVSTVEDVEILNNSAKAGIHIILTGLPDIDLINHSIELKQLMGIKRVEHTYRKANGLTFFKGFLLGGKTTYKKLKADIPYFHLLTGTKVYVTAELNDQKKKGIKNEELPPIIWRHRHRNSFIFTINWDFSKSNAALGMYTSMYADVNDYYIYPIVNAQCFVTQNYPYLSNETLGDIKQYYYHSSQALARNILWPDLVSIANTTNEHYTGMIAPQLHYESDKSAPELGNIEYFFQQNEQISGELGLSGDQVDGNNFYKNKLETDKKYLSKFLPNYTFTVFSPGKMPESVYRPVLKKKNSILEHIQTIVLPKEQGQKEVISYCQDDILSLCSTIDGFSHKNSEDIYLRSLETCLGYSLITMDFMRIYYPNSLKDDWTQLSKKCSSYLYTYWKEFHKCFDSATISEADLRARRFLDLNYNSYRRDNTITLSISNFDTEASFILVLTNEKIDTIEGATFQRIEKDRYLINATERNISMTIASDTSFTE